MLVLLLPAQIFFLLELQYFSISMIKITSRKFSILRKKFLEFRTSIDDKRRCQWTSQLALGKT